VTVFFPPVADGGFIRVLSEIDQSMPIGAATEKNHESTKFPFEIKGAISDGA
jgi:hypothetical protein